MILSEFWAGALISFVPTIIGGAIYTVRMEIRLTQIANDVKWINKRCNECQRISEKST